MHILYNRVQRYLPKSVHPSKKRILAVQLVEEGFNTVYRLAYQRAQLVQSTLEAFIALK